MVSGVWVEFVKSVTSLPEDLWLRVMDGRVRAGECEDDIELPALWLRDVGRSGVDFCLPKKCQLSYDCSC